MNFTRFSLKNDLWGYLSSTHKKIVMYGMGNGADKILAVCDTYGIEICDFFASDGFVRGHSFHGKLVLSYSDIPTTSYCFSPALILLVRKSAKGASLLVSPAVPANLS